MDTSRLLIVTAADETFVPLLKGLVESLHRHGTPQRGHFACLDVGLAAGSRDWLRGYTDRVVNPEWDIPLDDALAIAKPHLRAITARPFLPRYFPGYDIYLWMDADTWVQEWYAIDWYAAAAADGRLAIAAEVDRSYRQPVDVWKWRMERLFAYYGETAAKLLICGAVLQFRRVCVARRCAALGDLGKRTSTRRGRYQRNAMHRSDSPELHDLDQAASNSSTSCGVQLDVSSGETHLLPADGPLSRAVSAASVDRHHAPRR